MKAVFCQELIKTSVIKNKVSILIPKNFSYMSEEMIKAKYPMETRPTLVYSDKNGTVNVAVNSTPHKARSGDIKQYKDIFEQTFKNTYPSAKWISSGVKDIKGKKTGYLELVTPAIDTEIYNLIFFTDLDGKLLMCTFNCMIKDMKKWKGAAHKIMESLTVIEGKK